MTWSCARPYSPLQRAQVCNPALTHSVYFMKQQSGYAVLVFILAVLTLIVILLANTNNSASKTAVDRALKVSDKFTAIQRALTTFVALNGRLPCPASAAANTGTAAPDSAPYACTSLNGTVPWSTLGLPRSDAFDESGNHISYRVFSGATGLTQAGGASMADCDTVQTFPRAATASGLCRMQKDTLPASFLAGKGLTVNDAGTAVTDVVNDR